MARSRLTLRWSVLVACLVAFFVGGQALIHFSPPGSKIPAAAWTVIGIAGMVFSGRVMVRAVRAASDVSETPGEAVYRETLLQREFVRFTQVSVVALTGCLALLPNPPRFLSEFIGAGIVYIGAALVLNSWLDNSLPGRMDRADEDAIT